jgi:hypothetical protein
MEEDNKLIDFDTIEKNLEHTHQKCRGVEAIPIDKIVGSLGRYNDFNKEFLPQSEGISAKYENVKDAMLAGKMLPPIKVYQIFDSYFVIDGHHRVTVAKKELNAAAIDAEVIEIHFDIGLSPDKKYTYDTEQAKRFLIRLEEDAFERNSFLKNSILIYPLKVTDLTSFSKIYEEIVDFKKNYNNGELSKKAIIYSSLLWYETRFLPAVKIIIEENILDRFSHRTYTDLYLWIQQHKYYLSQKAGHDVGFDFTKKDFLKKNRKSKFFELLPPVLKEIIQGIKQELKEGYLPKLP